MTSFLSTLSSQFAKNILIGTLFPVVLFLIAISAVVLEWSKYSNSLKIRKLR